MSALGVTPRAAQTQLEERGKTTSSSSSAGLETPVTRTSSSSCAEWAWAKLFALVSNWRHFNNANYSQRCINLVRNRWLRRIHVGVGVRWLDAFVRGGHGWLQAVWGGPEQLLLAHIAAVVVVECWRCCLPACLCCFRRGQQPKTTQNGCINCHGYIGKLLKPLAWLNWAHWLHQLNTDFKPFNDNC